MPLKFPEPEETVYCPVCKGDRPFHSMGNKISREHKSQPFRKDSKHYEHAVVARFCRSCGYPIIQHAVEEIQPGRARKVHERNVYPEAPSRILAPALVREADEVLANDYDEAVK